MELRYWDFLALTGQNKQGPYIKSLVLAAHRRNYRMTGVVQVYRNLLYTLSTAAPSLVFLRIVRLNVDLQMFLKLEARATHITNKRSLLRMTQAVPLALVRRLKTLAANITRIQARALFMRRRMAIKLRLAVELLPTRSTRKARFLRMRQLMHRERCLARETLTARVAYKRAHVRRQVRLEILAGRKRRTAHVTLVVAKSQMNHVVVNA